MEFDVHILLPCFDLNCVMIILISFIHGYFVSFCDPHVFHKLFVGTFGEKEIVIFLPTLTDFFCNFVKLLW